MMPKRPTCGLLFPAIVVVSVHVSHTAAEDTLLPFEGSDGVRMYDPQAARSVNVSGAIEDIEGPIVLIRRRGSGRVRAIPLTHVDELRFSRSKAHTRAMTLFEESQFEQSLAACDDALIKESRLWVKDEIQATAVRCCLALNRRAEALRRIEIICKRDPATRHLGLLPLVWDERLPVEERYLAEEDDLQSPSLPRRLAAVSSLLHRARYTEECRQALIALRANPRHPIGVLAEIQQWRLIVLDDDAIRRKDLSFWKSRAAEMPPWIRAGAQYVLGRAHQRQHRLDAAAVEFLWPPFMRPDDRVLAAICLGEAADCLRQSGQAETSRQLQTELRNRFPETSAARHHQDQLAQPDPE